MTNKKVFVLLTKDAMCRDYLHFYGEKKGQFPTPNLDELVSKGTLFTRYYAAAASTVMAFYSMAKGVYAYETDIQMYERVHKKVEGESVFTEAKRNGYEEFHILWSKGWETLPDYYDYFGNDVHIHTIESLKASTGIYKEKEGIVSYDADLAYQTLSIVEDKLSSILEGDESKFVWIHLPHVLNGCSGYGSDIALFDKYLGMIRKYVPDTNIAVSSDHGNMNGIKGKLAYGFDLHDHVIRIPLILPRINNLRVCDNLVSSLDLFKILFTKSIPNKQVIFSETAYRAQNHRKLAIIKGKYKYVYSNKGKVEELYDLEFDPLENISLIDDKFYDVDRHLFVDMSEEYYYPDWNKLKAVREDMRMIKDKIWRKGDYTIMLKSSLKDLVRPFYEKWKRMIHS